MSVEYAANKYLDRAIQINKERPGLAAGNLAQAVQVGSQACGCCSPLTISSDLRVPHPLQRGDFHRSRLS